MSLESLGLNTALLDTFGFTSGRQIGATFGQAAAVDFVNSELGFVNDYSLISSYENYIDKIFEAQNVAEATGLTNLSGAYKQILASYAVAESYGLDINSITVSINPDGVISANTNLGTGTINLNEALNQALNSGQSPTLLDVPGLGTFFPSTLWGFIF
jgi:hypothetical protein